MQRFAVKENDFTFYRLTLNEKSNSNTRLKQKEMFIKKQNRFVVVVEHKQ